MLFLLILLILVVLAVSIAVRSRMGRGVVVVVACLVVISVAGIWVYDAMNRPYVVASWLNLKNPPESLSVVDCKDSGLLTDVDANCLIAIDPEHFPELLQGYDYHHYAAVDSQVSLATGTRQFALAHVYSATPETFAHGGAVTIYANAQRDRAIINLYVE